MSFRAAVTLVSFDAVRQLKPLREALKISVAGEFCVARSVVGATRRRVGDFGASYCALAFVVRMASFAPTYSRSVYCVDEKRDSHDQRQHISTDE